MFLEQVQDSYYIDIDISGNFLHIACSLTGYAKYLQLTCMEQVIYRILLRLYLQIAHRYCEKDTH